MRPLRIGTRGSALALAQARIVQAALQARHPDRAFELCPIAASADRQPEAPLASLAGEGIFVKELEDALLGGRIHLAVHSLKDLPLAAPKGLRIAAVPAREEARDALVSRSGAGFDALPRGARVGTSSARRRSQVLARRADLTAEAIRGNVDTRLRKLDEGAYDAILLAGCGLIRLGLPQRITELLDPAWMLPEPGQGALALEARTDDAETLGLAQPLDDAQTRACVEAERAFLAGLGGGCRLPIAAYAARHGAALALDGAVIAADGGRQLRGHLEGDRRDPVGIGRRLAEQLRAQGAMELLE